MATETKYPDAILAQSGWSTTPAVTSIDDDPDAPSGDWILASGTTASPQVRVSFPTPSGALTSGTQTFKAWVRKHGTGTGTPTVRLNLYEGGTLKATGTAVNVTNATGQLVTQTFSGLDTLLSDPSGASVEILVVGTVGGSGGQRASIDLDAVNWDTVDYTVAPLALSLGKVANTPSASTPPVPQSPLLDDFNRADNTSSLGASWTGSIIPSGWPSHGVLSNQLYPSGGFKSTYWNTLLGADQEVYATLAVIATSGSNPWTELCVRVQNPNSAGVNYYTIRVNSGSSFLIKSVAGTQTTIGGTYGAGQDGDVWGLQARGEKIYVWRKRAGSWSLLDTKTDSSVAGPGYIGVASGDDATIRVDDFGGGTIDTVWGPTIAPSGAAPLGTGKVATSEALHGLGLTPGAVALALGLVSSAQALHGIDLATGAAALELDLGHITTAEALHGLGLTPGVVALAVGKIAADELVHGLGLTASGAAALDPGKVATDELLHGPALAGSGAVELDLGLIEPRPVALLDDFNRADEDPIGGPNWTGVGFKPSLFSNGLEFTGGLLQYVAWNTTYAADQEAGVTLVRRTDDGYEFQIWLRGSDDLSANDGVEFRIEFGPTGVGDDIVQIRDAFSGTLYAEATGQSIANGDDILARVVGTTASLFQNGNLILTYTDAGLRNVPGNPYLLGNGGNTPTVDTTRVDDFVAGEVHAGVHGPTVSATGAAPLDAGKVASAELLHGLTVLGSGAASLPLGAIASAEAIYGIDFSTVGLLLLGKIDTTELLHGPALDASGSAALGLGLIASGAAPLGLELSSGGVVLLLGRVASEENLPGLDLTGSGTAALGLGRIGSTAAVRGPAILGSGIVALGLGHVASAELVRGLALSPGAIALLLGHVASTAAARGLDLAASGAAPLPVGKILTAAQLHGLDIDASGAVALGLGAIPSSSAVRGVRLVVQSGVASSVLVLESPAVAVAGDGPQIVVALTTPEITAALRAAGVDIDPDAPYIVLTLENL